MASRCPDTVKPEAPTGADAHGAASPVAELVVPTIRMPVDARGVALTVLAVVAAVCALYLAQTIIEQPGFELDNFLLAGAIGVLGFQGQAVMVLFLAFLLPLGE